MKQLPGPGAPNYSVVRGSLMLRIFGTAEISLLQFNYLAVQAFEIVP